MLANSAAALRSALVKSRRGLWLGTACCCCRSPGEASDMVGRVCKRGREVRTSDAAFGRRNAQIKGRCQWRPTNQSNTTHAGFDGAHVRSPPHGRSSGFGGDLITPCRGDSTNALSGTTLV